MSKSSPQRSTEQEFLALKVRNCLPLPPTTTAYEWELPNRKFKAKRLGKIRAGSTQKLRTAIIEILAAMKWMHGPVEFPLSRASSSYWHYKARNILTKMGFITVTRGYCRGPTDYRYSTISPSEALLCALEQWESAPEQPAPVIKEKHVPYLLTEINEVLAEHTYEGCAIPVLKRVMYTKNGCLHGRLYSLGVNSYQHLSDRTNIRINGKETAEIDISASHLTGFLGESIAERTLSEPVVTRDLYLMDGIPRGVVKAALMLIFGKGTLVGLNWYQLKDGDNDHLLRVCRKHNIAKIVSRLLEVYPQLRSVTDQTAPDLVWKESEAILGTIQELMAMGIPALPTHDSILVTTDAVEMAKEVLATQHYRMFGVKPMLKTKGVKERGAIIGTGSVEAMLEQAISRLAMLKSGLDKEPERTRILVPEAPHHDTPPYIFESSLHAYPTHSSNPRCRRPCANSEQAAEIKRLAAEGVAQRTIARRLGLGRQTVRTVCRSHNTPSEAPQDGEGATGDSWGQEVA